jgi:hypothetical protein
LDKLNEQNRVLTGKMNAQFEQVKGRLLATSEQQSRSMISKIDGNSPYLLASYVTGLRVTQEQEESTSQLKFSEEYHQTETKTNESLELARVTKDFLFVINLSVGCTTGKN